MSLLPISADDYDESGIIRKQPKIISEKGTPPGKQSAVSEALLKEKLKHMEATTSSTSPVNESPYKDTVTDMSQRDADMSDTACNQMKFRSPKEDCSPEDCCCCFYFLYLLFHQEIKPPAYEANPAVNSIRMLAKKGGASRSAAKDVVDCSRSPGYSYFKNLSTGSSIESKSSWLDRYCARDQIRDPSDDDNESDGWMMANQSSGTAGGNPAASQTAQSTPSTDQNDHADEPIIDLISDNDDPARTAAAAAATSVPRSNIIDYNDFNSFD